jgi:sarcosine oxidase subunit alpha
MSEVVVLRVNRREVQVPAGATVGVAVMTAGAACRTSVSGERRGPLCGMGVCFECRVTINGRAHCRSCQIVCESGMDVRTDD